MTVTRRHFVRTAGAAALGTLSTPAIVRAAGKRGVKRCIVLGFDGMDLLGGLSGTPQHRILTGRIRARTRDRQMSIWPTPRGRESASDKECDGRLGTPDKTPGDLFSPFGSPPPAERESESGNWKDDRGTTLRVMS